MAYDEVLAQRVRDAIANKRGVTERRLTCLFSGPDEQMGGPGRVELKSLRPDMQALYPQQVIAFRQIGPRDVAKLIGGLGACGLETRCCSMFLTEFSPVSIKMAKEQGISLNPDEITGMCGRLRCCLVYEYEQYVEARKQLPKRNKRVITPKGEGKVLDVFPLKETVLVELDQGTVVEFAHADIEPFDELEAMRKKAKEPCAKHGEGPRDAAALLESLYYLSLSALTPKKVLDSGPPEPGPPEGETLARVRDDVERLRDKLPLKDQVLIANMSEPELPALDRTLGEYIVSHFGLATGNTALRRSCRWVARRPIADEAAAAAVIIRALWKQLRRTHPLRRVK